MAINKWAAVTKAASKYNKEDVSQYPATVPHVLNNSSVNSINAAGTGVVELIKADASDVVTLPNNTVLGSGKTLVGNVVNRTQVPIFKTTVTTDATAGDLTYTAAMLLGGFINRDPGANRSDVTPAASLLVAAMPGATVGDSFYFWIRNNANGAETITVTAGSGCTLSGAGQSSTTVTIAQNASKLFMARLTNVTASSEAYVLYSILGGTH
jgi:hypothetical protein